jgi:hypothetical protein
MASTWLREEGQDVTVSLSACQISDAYGHGRPNPELLLGPKRFLTRRDRLLLVGSHHKCGIAWLLPATSCLSTRVTHGTDLKPMAERQRRPPTTASGSAPASPAVKKPRQRLSQKDVPAYSLDQALRVPKAIAENYAFKPTRPLNVAGAMSMSPTSGLDMAVSSAIEMLKCDLNPPGRVVHDRYFPWAAGLRHVQQ